MPTAKPSSGSNPPSVWRRMSASTPASCASAPSSSRGIAMNSLPRGTVTSVEVTNISNHGFWLLLDDEELFLAYADFPWFKNARVADLSTVERPTAEHLYWPTLDIDLAVASI